jgi:3-isopropylmalate/(R)-2-methylmalate dehydratase large subunit
MGPRTLASKIWEPHVVANLGDGMDLLFVDRHLLHDLAGVISLEEMAEKGLKTLRPDMTIATLDHAISTDVARGPATTAVSGRYVPPMIDLCIEAGIPMFELESSGQGIVHVVGPEQGLTLPGLSIVCGDSHTTTHGAFGALAWGIGSSEVTHVLATQTIRVRRPQAHRIRLTGELRKGVGAKDVILHVIGHLGVAAGVGAIVEWAGPVITGMSMEQRMVVCNMTVEMGAKFALVAPDQTTFDYIEGKPFAPKGDNWQAAVAYWRTLVSDEDAPFDLDREIDCSEISPQITWGTTPEQVVGIGDVVPDPSAEAEPARREAMQKALAYMDLAPGQALSDVKIDWVFIGSCAGGRIEDLRSAAHLLHGRRIADGVRGWIVPGSTAVREAAEAEGLDTIFLDAGFEWRQSGCSLCAASNGETVPAGARCVSTSNRNFVGRQGPRARTHIASPAVAAASALAGHIADPGRFL